MLGMLLSATTSAQDAAAITAMQQSMQTFMREVQSGQHKAAASTAAKLIPMAERLMGEGNPDVVRMHV
ncbi:hypothetical protein [Rubripirellula tenax]|nr:hypothetical protein [Rubripirellula tenax]